MCTNVIVWDGVSPLQMDEGIVAQVSDGSIGVGDNVQLLNGNFVKVSSPPGPTPQELFSVDIFVQDLLGAFAEDSNILPYYSVVKDLATFKNFDGMKGILMELLADKKITQDEATIFNSVLMKQGINLLGDNHV